MTAPKTPIPEGAKVPQDHAAKAEAKGLPVEFDFEGEHYSIDRENADNLELMEFIEDELYIKAIRGFLGADQWAHWKSVNRDEQGRVSAKNFEPFLNRAMAAIGGGSEASPNT